MNWSKFSREPSRYGGWGTCLWREAEGSWLLQPGQVGCKGTQKQHPSVYNEVVKKMSMAFQREVRQELGRQAVSWNKRLSWDITRNLVMMKDGWSVEWVAQRSWAASNFGDSSRPDWIQFWAAWSAITPGPVLSRRLNLWPPAVVSDVNYPKISWTSLLEVKFLSSLPMYLLGLWCV